MCLSTDIIGGGEKKVTVPDTNWINDDTTSEVDENIELQVHGDRREIKEFFWDSQSLV